MLLKRVFKHKFLALNALRIVSSFIVLKYLAERNEVDYIEYNRITNLIAVYSSYVLLNSASVFTFPTSQPLKNTLLTLSILLVILVGIILRVEILIIILLIAKLVIAYIFGLMLYQIKPDRESSQYALLLNLVVFLIVYGLTGLVGFSMLVAVVAQLMILLICLPKSARFDMRYDLNLRMLTRPIYVGVLVGFIFNLPSLIYLVFGPFDNLQEEVVFKSLVVSVTVLSVIQTNYFFIKDASISSFQQVVLLLVIAFSVSIAYVYFITSTILLSLQMLWLLPLCLLLVLSTKSVRQLKSY